MATERMSPDKMKALLKKQAAEKAEKKEGAERGERFTPPTPESNRQIQKDTLDQKLRAAQQSREAYVHVGAEHAADVLGVSGEIAEKLRTLEKEVDEKIVRILEIFNAGATVALQDKESYTYDRAKDTISAPRTNQNPLEALPRKEKILRELAVTVEDLPNVVEEILKLKDLTHSLLAPVVKKLEK